MIRIKWYGHDPKKWTEFRTRYRMELKNPKQNEAIEELAKLAQTKTITLLYGTKQAEQNQAVVLKDVSDEIR